MKTYIFDERKSNKFTFTPSTKLTPEVLLGIGHDMVDLTFVRVIGLSNYSLSELIIKSEDKHCCHLIDIRKIQRSLYKQFAYFTGDYYFEWEYSLGDGHTGTHYTTKPLVDRDHKNPQNYPWKEFKYDDNLNLISHEENYFKEQFDKYEFDVHGKFVKYTEAHPNTEFIPSNNENILCSVYENGKLSLEISLRNPK